MLSQMIDTAKKVTGVAPTTETGRYSVSDSDLEDPEIVDNDDVMEDVDLDAKEKLVFEIDDVTDVPPVVSRMVPSLWHAGNGQYKDAVLEKDDDKFSLLYDFPKKRTDRNHLVRAGAMMFMKTKIGWRFAGVVQQVVSTGYYEGTDQKYSELLVKKSEKKDLELGFNTKNTAIDYYGFKPLGEGENIYGLIPLYRR